jgi:peptidyl-prolyl cis-trans isomerase C
MPEKTRNFFAEPFVQFLILGGLLFLFTSYVQQQTDRESREIIVSNEQVNLMILNYKTQTGALPTKQQIDAIIDSYIREAISYREAKKMGLDNDDEIVRRRLAQKFDFLQTDLAKIPAPSDEDLQQFYKNNASLFKTEKTVSFSHIYFSTDNSTDSTAKQRALVVLQRLKQTNLQRAPDKGDRFPLQYDYIDQAAVDIQQNFGDRPILQELFKAPLNTWIGPVQSGYGWHLIYVTKLHSAEEIPFASIKEEVKARYIESEKGKQNKIVFDRLSAKYIIKRKYLETK